MNTDADPVRIDRAVSALSAASSQFEGVLLGFVADCIRNYLTGAIDETEFWGAFVAGYDERKAFFLVWQLKHPEAADVVRATYRREFALLESLLRIHEYSYYDRYFDAHYPDEWLDDIVNAPEEIVEYTLIELLLRAVEQYAMVC